MDRREFLVMGGVTAVSGVAGTMAGAHPADYPHQHLPSGASVPTGKLLTRKIPSTGEALPVIGLGTSGPFEVPTDEAARAP